MRIIRRADICQEVPEAWARQYARTSYAKNAEITVRLSMLLPQDRTPENIDAIIGNKSWTANRCDECGVNRELSVHLGDEPDYEARSLNLCLACLQKAAKMVKDAAP